MPSHQTVSRDSFDALYAHVEPAAVAALRAFRRAHPPRRLPVGGMDWEYVAAGAGKETIVFLHGMAGAWDIWWQQLDALKGRYRLIAVTYPPVRTLEAMAEGVLAILEREGIQTFNAVGTSLGGYFVQYLIAGHPERIRRAVLSNTFPPNPLIARKNRLPGMLLPFLPERLVLSVFRRNFRRVIYPTSGNDELTLAFLNEIAGGRMSKAQLLGRYLCVIEQFVAATPAIPLLIVESDNDPLVEPVLREQLKALYPRAAVYTFTGAGHFPYLNRAQEYTRLLAEFLRSEEG